MQPQMTVEQALQILDTATAKVLGSREDHRIIIQAIETLKLATTSIVPEVVEETTTV